MHSMSASDVLGPHETLHGVVPRIDDVQGYRRSQEPLPHQRTAQRRLRAVENPEERQAFLGFVRMDGRVVLILENLQGEQGVGIDLHSLEKGQRFDIANLKSANTLILKLGYCAGTCEVVQESANRS